MKHIEDVVYPVMNQDIDMWEYPMFRLLAALFVAWCIWLGVARHRSQDEIDFPDEDLDDEDTKR